MYWQHWGTLLRGTTYVSERPAWSHHTASILYMCICIKKIYIYTYMNPGVLECRVLQRTAARSQDVVPSFHGWLGSCVVMYAI